MVNTTPHEPCPQWAEKLAALHPAELSPSERAALDTHLISCQTCAAIQREYAILRNFMQDLPSSVPAPGLPPQLMELFEEQDHTTSSLTSAPPRLRSGTELKLHIAVLCPDERFAEVPLNEPKALGVLVKECLSHVLPQILGGAHIKSVTIDFDDQDKSEDAYAPTPERFVRVRVLEASTLR